MSEQENNFEWPIRPTCHDGDSRLQPPFTIGRDEDVKWQQREEVTVSRPVCWFCGSLHPQDLLELLQDNENVVVELADMKYGWPHKFYLTEKADGKRNHWKFYSEHLIDLGDRELEAISKFMYLRTGVEFKRDEIGIGYRVIR